jgi:hypothetical protein
VAEPKAKLKNKTLNYKQMIDRITEQPFCQTRVIGSRDF